MNGPSRNRRGATRVCKTGILLLSVLLLFPALSLLLLSRAHAVSEEYDLVFAADTEEADIGFGERLLYGDDRLTLRLWTEHVSGQDILLERISENSAQGLELCGQISGMLSGEVCELWLFSYTGEFGDAVLDAALSDNAPEGALRIWLDEGFGLTELRTLSGYGRSGTVMLPAACRIAIAVLGETVSGKNDRTDEEASPIYGERAALPASERSVQGAAAETEELHRYTVTASGLETEPDLAVVAEIADAQGSAVCELELTAEENWTADWEIINPTGSYTARLKSILGPGGVDRIGDWRCNVETTDGERQTGITETIWKQRSQLTEGLYVFELQPGPNTLLAASNKLSRSNGYYYYALIAENAEPRYAGSAAQWSVSEGYATGYWNIVNVASQSSTPGYLSILCPVNKNICAAFDDATVSICFQNGAFSLPVNGTVNYLKFPGATSTTTDEGAATLFTPYQLTDLTRYTTEHICELFFSPDTVNGTTAARVSLTVEGNFADLSKRFSFTVLVNGENFEEFELGNGEQYTVEGIPCASTLTVQEDAGDYSAVSSWNGTAGSAMLEIDEVPNGEIDIQFTNSLEGDIETGIYDDIEPALFLLTAVLASAVIIVGRKPIL